MSGAGNIRPYDREEWEKIAHSFLATARTTSSEFESAYIALRIDNPELAELCRQEGIRKRKNSYGKRDKF
jgi:hypothetical protein